MGGNGAVSVANGTITYTPAADFSGTDAFSYAVDDDRGGSAQATITVDVVNTPPIAGDGSAFAAVGRLDSAARAARFACVARSADLRPR